MDSSIILSFNAITPNLRHANLLQCPPGAQYGPRKIYDYQFVYVHKGKGVFVIEDHVYHAIPGDLFFYGPGVVHDIIADFEDPFLLSGVCMDFTQNHRELGYPIGSYLLNKFQPDRIPETVEFIDFKGFMPRINLASDERVSKLFLEMVQEYKKSSRFCRTYMNGLLSMWLSIVAQHTDMKRKGFKQRNHSIDNILDYIHNNYNREIKNSELGKLFKFHPNHLSRLVLAYTGVPLHQYIVNLRIKKSIELLIYTNKSISEISSEIGYDDIHYFTRLFSKKTGLTPGKLRQGIDRK